MTTSTILYRIDTWFLRRQRINEYAILTLTGYQQHYAMQADILPDIGTMSIVDMMQFPFDITAIIQYQ